MANTKTARLHADALAVHLNTRLPHRRVDALRRLAKVLLTLLPSESTPHRKIALHLPQEASPESKTCIVARGFHPSSP